MPLVANFSPLLSIPQGVEKLNDLRLNIPLPEFIKFLRPIGSLVARLKTPVFVGSTDLRHLPSRPWNNFLDGVEITCIPIFLPCRSLVLVISAEILEFEVIRTILGPLLVLVTTQVFPVVREQLAFVGRPMTPRCERTSVAGADTPLTVSPYVTAALLILVG